MRTDVSWSRDMYLAIMRQENSTRWFIYLVEVKYDRTLMFISCWLNSSLVNLSTTIYFLSNVFWFYFVANTLSQTNSYVINWFKAHLVPVLCDNFNWSSNYIFLEATKKQSTCVVDGGKCLQFLATTKWELSSRIWQNSTHKYV